MILPPEPPESAWVGLLQMVVIALMTYGLGAFIKNAYGKKHER